MNNVQAIIGVIAVCLIVTCGSLAYGYMQNDESVIDSQGETTMAASGTCGDNLTWSLDDQGTMTINGTGPMYNYTLGKQPWKEVDDNIQTLIINDGVTAIGDLAFYGCTSLASVTIPDSVTTIGLYVFYNCTSLASVTIPDSVTTIGPYVFNNCTSLVSVTIPDSVTTIEHGVFHKCTSLASVTIPDSVTFIEGDAFYRCESLHTVYNQSSLTFVKGSDDDGCVAKYAETLVQGNATVTLVRDASDSTQEVITLSVKPGESKILDYSFITKVPGTNKVTTITHTATGWAEQQ